MVTGFNVNIRNGGKVYHVQTEDRGRKSPIIETLIYMGGKIIHQERISYADQNEDHLYDENRIIQLVDRQHKRLVDAVQQGVFDPDRKPYGEEFLTGRSLDECVLAYLEEEYQKQTLALQIVSVNGSAGARGAVVVHAHRRESVEQPLQGVTIRGRILQSSGSTMVGETATDASGRATLVFDFPATANEASALLIQAESEHGREELHHALR